MSLTLTTTWIDAAPEPEAVGANADAGSVPVFGATDENDFRRDCGELLRKAGLRPTRQRLALGWLLFANGGRHLTAEMLHAEATRANIQISLATVYNTLNQLTNAGLLRQIGVDGSKSFFDSNPTAHHHFFVDNEERLLDVPEPGVQIDKLPAPLPGCEIAGVDVIIHLRRKQSPTC